MTAPAELPLVERLTSEGLINLGAAAKLCGTFRGGAPTSPSTVSRWAEHGVKRADGAVVRLESIRMPGGRRTTSKAAVLRFLAALQGGPVPETPTRTPAARNRAADAAGQKLIEMGA